MKNFSKIFFLIIILINEFLGNPIVTLTVTSFIRYSTFIYINDLFIKV